MGFLNVTRTFLVFFFFSILAAVTPFNMCCRSKSHAQRLSASKAPVIAQARPVGCVCVGLSCPTCAHPALFALPRAVNPFDTCLCSTVLP